MQIDELLSWLHIDSTTGNEAAYLEVLEKTLAGDGLRVEQQRVTDDRWNLLALPAGTCRVLLCTHVDTVPPFFGPTVAGEHICARGACDTKGGLFSMMEMRRRLPRERRDQVGFLLLVGEEVDHIGAIVANARLALPALECIFVCEPTRNRLAAGQKGILKVRLRTRGKAGHSAFPEAGRSAIHELIDVLGGLLGADWPSDPVLGPTTVNVGTIGGGVAANIFAPEANAELLFRVTSGTAPLLAQLREAAGPGAEVEVLASNESLRLHTWPGYPTDIVPFNTDAPYLASHAPIVLVGPGDIRNAHSPDEHITRSDMEAGVDLYSELVEGVLSRGIGSPGTPSANS